MSLIDSETRIDAELRRATTTLRNAGVEHPRRQALLIWAALTGKTAGAVWQSLDIPMTGNESVAFRRAVDLYCSGMPIPYIVGKAAFRHLELEVSEHALIPRPETEGLVDLALDWFRTRVDHEPLRGLEIGVGSGCVVLSLACESNFSELIGTEISSSALDVARRNHNALCPHTNVDLRLGSFFEPVPERDFDLVISNPPYITAGEYSQLEHSVRRFEPRVALVSPEDGMLHIREVCRGAAKALSIGGLLLLEIDERRGREARAVAIESGFSDTVILKDLFGCDRYLRAVKESTP